MTLASVRLCANSATYRLLEDAIIRLKSSWASNADSPEILFQLSLANYQQVKLKIHQNKSLAPKEYIMLENRMEQVIDGLEKLVAIDNRNVNYLIQLGLSNCDTVSVENPQEKSIERTTKYFTKAANYLEKALNLDPQCMNNHFLFTLQHSKRLPELLFMCGKSEALLKSLKNFFCTWKGTEIGAEVEFLSIAHRNDLGNHDDLLQLLAFLYKGSNLKLKILNTASCSVTDNTLISLCTSSGQNLQELNVSFTKISNKTVDAILQYCPNIKILDLSMCDINEKSLGKMVLNSLEQLHLGDCKVGESTLIKIVKKCPSLKKLECICSSSTTKKIQSISTKIQITSSIEITITQPQMQTFEWNINDPW